MYLVGRILKKSAFNLPQTSLMRTLVFVLIVCNGIGMYKMTRRGLRITPDRWQSKNINTIDERRSKIVKNRVFECHLLPDLRLMAIENTVSSDF